MTSVWGAFLLLASIGFISSIVCLICTLSGILKLLFEVIQNRKTLTILTSFSIKVSYMAIVNFTIIAAIILCSDCEGWQGKFSGNVLEIRVALRGEYA